MTTTKLQNVQLSASECISIFSI